MATMFKRIIRVAVYSLLGFLILMAGLLAGCQRKLIYFPSPYGPGYETGWPGGTVALEYDTPQGKQTAFYVPPRAGGEQLPDQIWMTFSGNASLALYWLDLVESYPDEKAGFLLFDYPGYGLCEGKPSRNSIRESADAAYAELARHFGASENALECRLCLLGHSLGAAAALDFGAARAPARIVMISPFTNLLAMARRSVGWPLCYVLRDRYDNAARLDEISVSGPPPAVTIIHGGADQIVPVKMGRELAGMFPGWIVYCEIEGGDHNWIVSTAAEWIIESMLREPVSAEGEEE
jgi:fermentation-respiration switch protein FrsA (DUF1100 family)